MAIPPGAVYVSEDGLVTFDQYGRKLDSLGNVAWDDTQGAWGANAKPIERPQQQMQQQPQTQQAATPVVKAATGAYSPSVSATPQQGAAPQGQARPWADPMPPMTALGQPQSQGFRPQPQQPMPQPMPQQQRPQMMQPQPPIPQYWPQQQQMAPPEVYNPYDFNPSQQVPYSSAWKPSW